MTSIRIRMTRATLGLAIGATLSLCLACSVTAQPSQSQVELPTELAAEQPNARTLTRDSGAGGPATIEVGDTDVFFESAELNAALESLEAGRPAAAIEAFSTTQEGHGPESAFLYGYALYVDGQNSRALDALMACASEAPLWANHCLFWAAEVALRSDDPTQAERLAGMVDASSAFGPRAHFLRSRALAELDQHSRAVDGFEEFVAAYPNAWYRRQVDFALGASLEQLSRFDDAAAVYHRIEIEHPGTRDETAAIAAIDAIREQLSETVAAQISNLSSREAVQRAEGLLDRRRHDELIELLRPVAASEAPGSPLFCEAEYTIAKAFRYKREHSDALPHFQQVIDHCEGDTRMKALYNAGRSAWTVDDDARALAFFQTLAEDYEDQSYADDGMLMAARVTLEMGDRAGYERMLREQIERWPNGDMLGSAVWRMGQDLYDDRNFQGFIQFVEEVGTRTGEDDAYTRGRLNYFRARSLEQLGLVNEANAAYREVARRQVMTWYALLSLNRLNLLDPEGTREFIDELRTPAPNSTEGRIEVSPPEVASDEYFRRGTLLLRLHLYDLAEGEFDKLSSRYANNDDLKWLLSSLYARVGAFNRSYQVPGALGAIPLSYPNDVNRERWMLAFPRPYEDLVRAESAANEIDPYMVWAVMRQESGYRTDAMSPQGARGLLQLMLPTAEDMARRVGRDSISAQELFEPAINIELGASMLRMLFDRYSGHHAVLFPSYNAGLGRLDRWVRSRSEMEIDTFVEHMGIAEAQHYAKGVTMRYWTYRWIYADEGWDLLDVPFALPPR